MRVSDTASSPTSTLIYSAVSELAIGAGRAQDHDLGRLVQIRVAAEVRPPTRAVGRMPDGAALDAAWDRGRARRVLGISEAVADESLRAQAKQALEQALGSDNEQVRLRAAQSLYSYRAAAPPSTSGTVASEGLWLQDGRKVVGLADLLELCLQRDRGVFDSARMQDVILRAAQRVRELQAAGVRVKTPKP